MNISFLLFFYHNFFIFSKASTNTWMSRWDRYNLFQANRNCIFKLTVLQFDQLFSHCIKRLVTPGLIHECKCLCGQSQNELVKEVRTLTCEKNCMSELFDFFIGREKQEKSKLQSVLIFFNYCHPPFLLYFCVVEIGSFTISLSLVAIFFWVLLPDLPQIYNDSRGRNRRYAVNGLSHVHSTN